MKLYNDVEFYKKLIKNDNYKFRHISKIMNNLNDFENALNRIIMPSMVTNEEYDLIKQNNIGFYIKNHYNLLTNDNTPTYIELIISVPLYYPNIYYRLFQEFIIDKDMDNIEEFMILQNIEQDRENNIWTPTNEQLILHPYCK